ncbi:hypothetical protein [Streptomyces orinoci]|uniref:Uncharacterized protein n=1 Tax=Streptomyces orinoci TaxID=67339 RepID=A0ABV3K5G4_STRON|nr:hypothetical protein [Streptomyces orinoci]
MNQPPPDDHGLIAPVSLPRTGQAPGEVSGPEEYDGFFRIHHGEISDTAWAAQTLAVTRKVADDLPGTSLDEAERADLLDGMNLLLQHALTLTTDH